MNKRLLAVVSLLAVGILFVPSASFAAKASISIGANAWYIWWIPGWADNKSLGPELFDDHISIYKDDAHDFKPSSNVMAGPSVSVSFLERWNISSVFVIGRIVNRTAGPTLYTDCVYQGMPLLGPTRKEYIRDTIKWDSDTTLGYSITSIFRVFVGFKAQGYRYDERLNYIDFTGVPSGELYLIRSKMTDSVRNYGPGAGIGVTVPLVESLYLLANVSGVVLWGYEQGKFNRSYAAIIGATSSMVPSYIFLNNGRFMSYGGTSSISLAYVVNRINATFALGGRYQLLYNRQRSNNVFDNDVTLNLIDRQYDHFFGFTFSAIYTFNLGKTETD